MSDEKKIGCGDSEEFLEYGTSTQVYSQQKQVVLDDFCNAITLKNIGNTIAIFQEDPLAPGESKFIGGNRKELYRSRVDIRFALPTPPPAIPVNLVVVTQKFYLNIRTP